MVDNAVDPPRRLQVIHSEDEAWKLLRQLLRQEKSDEELKLQFDGWPNFHVKLSVGKASLRPGTMRAIVDFQDALWRTHALLAYGEPNIARLKDYEREALELEILVRGGSTNLWSNPKEFLENLQKGVLDRMTGKQITIAVISVALLYFSGVAWKDYWDDRVELRKAELIQDARLKELEVQAKLSADETERMKLFSEATKAVPKLNQAKQEADEARNSFMKNAPENSTLEFQGQVITGSTAHELAKNPRIALSENRVEGIYSIRQVDARKASSFRVQLYDLTTGASFSATLSEDAKNTALQNAIQAATFQRRAAKLVIDVRRKHKRIEKAEILEAELMPPGWRPHLKKKRG